MDLPALHQRVIALDVHQAKITACAVVHDGDSVRHEIREFGAFKSDRRALTQWAREIAPELVAAHPVPGAMHRADGCVSA